jgi:hypothetical protein
VNATAQHDMVEEGGIAAFSIGKALRFQRIQKFLTGNHFIVNEVRDLVWKKTLREIEFDEENNANLAWPFNRFRQPVKKGVST